MNCCNIVMNWDKRMLF